MGAKQDTENSEHTRTSATTTAGKTISLFAGRWFALLALAAFLVNQWPALVYCWRGWMEPDGYYSHGPLVPILAGIMVWGTSRRLRGAKAGGSWYGVPMLLFGALFEIVAISMSWEPLLGPGLLLAVCGAVVSFAGLQAARMLAFPTLFLATMVPLPSMLLDAITSRFQIVATTIAANALRLVDGTLIQDGNILRSAALAQPLMVDKPCSGLKLLIALVTSTLFLAWIVDGRWWKKAALVAMSFPLSIAVNALRVVMVGYVGIRTHSSETVATFHDYSGVIGLVICCFAVLGCAALLRMRRRADLMLPGPEPAPRQAVARRLRTPMVAAFALICIAAIVTNALDKLYALPRGQLAREAVPDEVGRWAGEEQEVPVEVSQALDRADILERVYVDKLDGGQAVQLLMIASLDLSAFHSPRICLPGSGVDIVEETSTRIDPQDAGLPPIKATLLRLRNDGARGLMIYWYTAGNLTFSAPAELVAWNRARRVDDLKRLASNPAAYGEVRRDVLSRQITLHRFYTEATDGEPDLSQLTKFIGEFLGRESTSTGGRP